MTRVLNSSLFPAMSADYRGKPNSANYPKLVIGPEPHQGLTTKKTSFGEKTANFAAREKSDKSIEKRTIERAFGPPFGMTKEPYHRPESVGFDSKFSRKSMPEFENTFQAFVFALRSDRKFQRRYLHPRDE